MQDTPQGPMVSEFAYLPKRARTGNAALRQSAPQGRAVLLRTTTALVGVGLALAGTTGTAQANPTGGQVVGGAATISQPNASTVNVTQTTDRAAINWQSFSIDKGQTTQFVQPSASSVALNRVVGADPSVIAGTLKANGIIVLVNPSGIAFSQGSQVDVNGLVATVADIKNENFMAGGMTFDQASKNPNAGVSNKGTITVGQAGLAALVAPSVSNSGVIQAKLGKVVLAGAETFTADLYGDGLVSFDVSSKVKEVPVTIDGKPATALVSNTGQITADGGHILLTADAVDGILTDLVDAGGKLKAQTEGKRTGTVEVTALGAGTVNLSGTVDVSGLKAGQTGGTAGVTGDNTVLSASAKINARGSAGGGTVKIGGGAHGKDPTLANAKNTAVAAGAAIDASAVAKGKGGNVTVWSDGTTKFNGTILAKGGAQGGDGGFVETSGKKFLNIGVTAKVDASAPHGKAGQWLLDPDSNVDITNATTNGSFDNGTPNTFTPNADNSKVDAGTIVTSLNAGTSVTITTDNSGGNQAGNITVDATIAKTAGGDATLTLLAGAGGGAGGIQINQAISSTAGQLSLVLNTTSGDVSFANTVNTNGGALTVDSGGAISQTAAGILTVGGATSLTGTTVTLTDATNALTGAITLSTTSDASITNNVATSLAASSVGGNLTIVDSTGNLTATGVLTVGGASSFTTTTTDATISLSTNNALTGAVTLNTTGTAGNASLTNHAATSLAASSIGGTLTVLDTAGNLSQAGALTVGGASSFTTTTTNATITLTSATNALSGGVTLGTTGATSSASLTNNVATSLAFASVQGTLTIIDSTGNLSQTGALHVGGASSFTTTATDATITLTTAANTLTGAVTLGTTGTNGNVSLTNNVATSLAASTIGGTLTVVDSTGNLSQAGALSVGGTSSFTTSATDATITLTSATNALTGAVTLGTTGTNGNASLTNNVATSLAASTIDGTLTVVDSTGNLSQTGALTVTGASSFTTSASNATITLTSATNALTGAVTLSTTGAGGNASLTNNVTTSLATSTIGGTLTVVDATGNLSQTGPLTVTGASSFTTSATDATITLTDAANALTGAVTLSTTGTNGNASLTNNASTGTTLATSTVGGYLSLTNSQGNVTQTGALTTGTAGLALNGAGSFTLTDTGNSIATLAGSVGTLSLTDSAALTIDTVAGSTSLAATGNIALTDSNAGGITVATTRSVSSNAANGQISFLADSLTLTGTVQETGGGTVAVIPYTASTAINIGGTPNTGLYLTTAELNQITANTLNVGSFTGTGTLTVTGALDTAAGHALEHIKNFSLTTASGNIAINNPITLASTGLLQLNSGGTVDASGAALTVSGAGSGLNLNGAGTFTLTNSGNSIGRLSGVSGNTIGSLALNDSAALTINSAGPPNGLSATGDITLNDTNAGGITVAANQTVSSSGANKTITFIADSLTLAGTVQQTGGGEVSIAPSTQTTAINIGGTPNTGLFLTTAELNRITAHILGVGFTSDTGALTVTGTLDGAAGHALEHIDSLYLFSGTGGIAVNNPITLSTAGAVLLLSTTGTADASGAALTVGATGAGLKLLGGGNFTLTNASNSFSTLAGTVGTLSLVDSAALAIDTVSFNNLTATGNVSLIDSNAGGITVTQNLSSTGGVISLFADSQTLTGTVQSTSTVRINPYTASTAINIGGTPSSGLFLTTAELNRITASTLTVGNLATDGSALVGTGALTVTGALSTSAGGALEHISSHFLVLGSTLSTGGIAVNNPIAIQTLTLAQGFGTIDASGGALTLSTLTLASNGTTTLTNSANNIGTLQGFSGNLSLVDSGALTIGGGGFSSVVAGGTISLQTDSLTLNATLQQTGGGTVTIKPNTISTAVNIGGTPNTGLFLTTAALNEITAKTLAVGAAGDTGALTVTGTLDTVAGDALEHISNLTLVSGSGGIAINNAITLASTGILTLNTSGTADASAAALTMNGAGSGLLLAGTGTFTLTNTSNSIGAVAGTGGSLMLMDSAALTVGTVGGATGFTATTGNVSLNTTGALTLNASLSDSANMLTLSSGAAISQTGGVITAGTLTGGSTTTTSLPDANVISTLGPFTTSGSFTLFNTSTLTQTISTTLNSGAGDVTIDNGAAAFTQSGTITTTSNTATAVTIQNTGALSVKTITTGSTGTATLGTTGATVGTVTEASGGAITTGTLAGASSSSVTLDSTTNAVTTLSGITAATNLTFINSGALSATGVKATAGTLSITTLTGNLGLTGNVKAGTTATLTATGGAISQTAGVLTAGTLTGSSGTTTTLDDANVIGNLGAFTTGGAFSLDNTATLTQTAGTTLNAGAGDIAIDNGGAAFTQSGAITTTSNTATAVTIQNTAALSVKTISTGSTGTVTLGAAGLSVSAISQASGGVITTGTLTGYSSSSVALTGANVIANLGAFTASGNFTLDNTAALTQTPATTLNVGAGDITIDDGGAAFTQSGTITTTSNTANAVKIVHTAALSVETITTGSTGTVTLGATGVTVGAITETGGGVITTGTLTGKSTASVALTGANVISNLGAFTASGAFTLDNTISLTQTASTLDAGGGDITIDNGGAAFTQGGTITTTSSSAAAVTIKNTAALSVKTITTGSTGTVTLGATGATVDAITQASGGVITAGTLTGKSTASVALNRANMIRNLGAFTASGNFTLDNTTALTQTAATTLDAGAGDVTIDNGGASFTQSGTITTTSNTATAVTLQNTGALSVNVITTGAAGTVTLGASGVAVGAITETAGGVITAGTLTGKSTGSVALTGANVLSNLGAFTSSGAFTLNNTATLTQTASTLDAGAGNITIDNGGAAFTQGGTITTTGAAAVTIQNTAALSVKTITTGSTGTVTLGATGVTVGAITEATGGVITAGTLTGKSTGSVSLNLANVISNLGAFTASGAFTLDNTAILTQTAATTLDSGAGAITIDNGGAAFTQSGTITTTGAAVTIQNTAALSVKTITTGAAGTVTLTANGAITQATGGVITTGTLTGSSVGTTSLLGANAITTLGAFTTTSGGNFLLKDTSGLTVGGTLSAAGNLYLDSSNAAGITVGATGSATAGSGKLASFQADTLTLAAGGTVSGATFEYAPDTIGNAVTLGSGGTLVSLAGITAANNRIGAVTIPGSSLTTTAGSITTLTAFDLANANLELDATGAITGTAGALTSVATLSGSAGTSANLNNTGNSSATLSGFTAGTSLTYVNAGTLAATNDTATAGALSITTQTGDLTVNGVSGGTTVALVAAGNLMPAGNVILAGDVTAGTTATLTTASGNISQSAGKITATTLTGSATTGVSLNDANIVTNLGAFANTVSGSFSFTNAQSFATTGAVSDTVGTLTLRTTAGNISLGADVTGTGQTVTLNSAGSIAQTAGVILANGLAVSASGSTVLNDLNDVATLAANITNGGLVYRDANDFVVGSVAATPPLGTLTGVITSGTGAADHDIALISATGSISLQKMVGARGAGTVTGNIELSAVSGTVSEPEPPTAGGIIKANGLIVRALTVDLEQNNLVDYLSVNGTGSSGVAFNDNQALTVGSVTVAAPGIASDTLAFTTVAGDTALNIAGSLTLAASVNAGTHNLLLQSTSNVTQTGGSITAGGLAVQAMASSDLTSATNNISTLAASITGGGLTYRDADGFAVSTVAVAPPSLGGTLAGVTTAGSGTADHDIALVSVAGSINLAANVDTLGSGSVKGNVELSAVAGTVSEPEPPAAGGIIKAAGLIVRAVTVDLERNNLVDTLSVNGTGALGVAFNDSQALTVGSVTVAAPVIGTDTLPNTTVAGDTGLIITGSLTLASSINAETHNLLLQSTAGVNQTGGSITAGGLMVTAAANSTLASTGNDIASLAANITGGGFSYSDANGFSVDTVTVTPPSLGGTLSNVTTSGPGAGDHDIGLIALSGSIDLVKNIDALGTGSVRGNVLLLATAGTVSESTGIVKANGLIARAGTINLGQGNLVNILAANGTAAAGITFNDSQALLIDSVTVAAPGIAGDTLINVMGAGDAVVKSAGALTLNADINVGAHNLLLATTTGNIVEPEPGSVGNPAHGVIVASGLALSSAGTIDLEQANLVTTLGAAASGGIAFNDGLALTVGTVQTAAPTLNQQVTGLGVSATGDAALKTASALTIAANVNVAANNLLLQSTGSGITQTSGSIIANNLLVLAATNSSLAGAANNVVGLAAAVTAGGFTYGDANDFTVGSVTVAPPSLGASLTGVTTAGAGATDHDVALISGAGSISLVNNVDAQGVGSTKGNILLSALAGTVSEPEPQNPGGIIKASGLIIRAAKIDLEQNNLVDTLSINATGAAGVAFNDSLSLTVNTATVAAPGITPNTLASSTAAGDTAIKTAGSLTLATDLNAGTHNLLLQSASNVTQTGGAITAGGLMVVAAANSMLASAGNDVAALAANVTGGGFSYVDANSFAVTSVTVASPSLGGTLSGVTTSGSAAADHDIGLVAATGSITLANTIDAQGTSAVRGNVLLSATGGTASETTGFVKANGLIVRATTIDLPQSNLVNILAMNGTGAGGASFNDGQALTVGSVTVAAPGIASDALSGVTATGDTALKASGALTLNSNLSLGAKNLSLTSTTAGVSQTGGAITAGGLLVSAATNSALASATNDVVTLAATVTGGGFSYVDANGFAVGSVATAPPSLGGTLAGVTTAGAAADHDIGLVTVAGSISLLNTVDAQGAGSIKGNVLLSATAGTVSEPEPAAAGGIVKANGLIVRAVSVDLEQNNLVDTLAAVGSGSSGIAFNDAQALSIGSTTVAAPGIASDTLTGVTATGDTALKASGALTLNSNLALGARNLSLTSTTAGVTQTGGAITAGGLLVSAATNSALASATNDVVTLAATITGGGFSYVDANGFAVGSVTTAPPSLGGTLAGVTTAGAAAADHDIGLVTVAGSISLLNTVDAQGAGSVRGNVLLSATAGTVSEPEPPAAGGIVKANGLIVRAATIDLEQNNLVNLLALTGTGPAGIAVTMNIFVGMVEAPLVIRPYLRTETRSGLFIIMTAGMAMVAGTVMVLYATLLNGLIPNPIGQILTASIMAAPATIVIAFIIMPEDPRLAAATSDPANILLPPSPGNNMMSVITKATIDGLQIFANVIGMLIVLVALVAIANSILNLFPDIFGGPLTLQRAFGWVLSPMAWLLGIPWDQAPIAGGLLGTKMVLNELIAYTDMSKLPADALSERSRMIMTYALCGFANFSSIGITIGGIAAMVPERRPDIIELAPKAMLAGSLATCLSGAVIGILT